MRLKAILAGLAAAFLLCVGPAPAAQPERPNPRLEGGPQSLIFTDHVAPKARLAFRRAVEAAGGGPLAAWKARGDVVDYQLLWNRYVDDPSWTMMTFAQFRSPEALARWREAEARTPAALPPAALALVSRVETAPADLMRESRKADPSAPPSVYLVVPYDYLIGTDAYVDYVDSYVLKQADGWMAENVLTGYRFYLGRYAATRPWSSLLVLEYRGDAGLGARDAIVAKVRKRLAADPEWARYAAGKDKIREERTPAVADPLPVR
jgi:hypothetical protein